MPLVPGSGEEVWGDCVGPGLVESGVGALGQATGSRGGDAWWEPGRWGLQVLLASLLASFPQVAAVLLTFLGPAD